MLGGTVVAVEVLVGGTEVLVRVAVLVDTAVVGGTIVAVLVRVAVLVDTAVVGGTIVAVLVRVAVLVATTVPVGQLPPPV
jgi:hypothetical protein